MPKTLLVVFNQLEPGTRAALLLLSVIAGYLNFEGLSATFPQQADSFWWKCSALIAATGVFTVLLIFWAYALAIIPSLVARPRHLLLALLAVMAFLPLIFFMSATWNVAFLAKPETERLNHAAAVQLSDGSVSAFARRTATAGDLISDLEALHAYLSSLAQREAEAGVVSGDRRCMAVCNTLQTQALSVGTLLNEAKRGYAASQAKVQAANDVLRRLRALGQSPAGERPPLQATSDLLAELNGVMAEAQAVNIGGTVGRTVAALPDSLIVPPGATARQRDAIESVRSALRQRISPIHARAQILEAMPPVPAIAFQAANALRSAYIYYDSLIAQWAMGLSVDILPLFLLVYRIIGAHALLRAAPEPMRRVTELWTIAQLQDAQVLLQMLDRHPKPPRLDPIALPGPPQSNPEAPTPDTNANPPPNGRRRGRPRKVRPNEEAAR